MPSSFFHLAFLATCDPKRIVWAYDELQNLSQYSMAPPAELFGQDSTGRPNILTIENRPGQAKQDLILPVCYRNTPWALTSAHALGFGVYRSMGLVQFFDNPELWRDVGYEVVSGRLRLGEEFPASRRKSRYAVGFGNVPPKLPARCPGSRCSAGKDDAPSWIWTPRRSSRRPISVPGAPSEIPARCPGPRRSIQVPDAAPEKPTGHRQSGTPRPSSRCAVRVADAASRVWTRRSLPICRVANSCCGVYAARPPPSIRGRGPEWKDPLLRRPLLLGRRRGRHLVWRVLLELLHQDLDRLLQGRVLALRDELGPVDHLAVRRDASRATPRHYDVARGAPEAREPPSYLVSVYRPTAASFPRLAHAARL
jgi:hypothetical protein